MMAAVHFFDNALGGSAAGMQKTGLTNFGIKVLCASLFCHLAPFHSLCLSFTLRLFLLYHGMQRNLSFLLDN